MLLTNQNKYHRSESTGRTRAAGLGVNDDIVWTVRLPEGIAAPGGIGPSSKVAIRGVSAIPASAGVGLRFGA